MACNRGLELIYEFLQSDEAANRPELLAGEKSKKVRARPGAGGGVGGRQGGGRGQGAVVAGEERRPVS